MTVYQILIAFFMVILAALIIYHDKCVSRDGQVNLSNGPLTLTVFVSIIASLISASSFIVAYQQYSTAKMNYNAAYRPWVGTNDLTAQSDFARGADGNWSIQLRAKLTNFGHFPANNVLFLAKIYFQSQFIQSNGISLPDEVLVDNEFCKSLSSDARRPYSLGNTIFPGNDIIINTVASGSKTDEERTNTKDDRNYSIITKSKKSLSFFGPIIIGCVTYTGFTKSDVHKTPFIIDLEKRNEDGVTVMLDRDRNRFLLNDIVLQASLYTEPPS